MNDPRPENPYDRLYTVEFLNNMTDAPLVLYINQPSDVLKQLAFESIKDNEVSALLSPISCLCLSVCFSVCPPTSVSSLVVSTFMYRHLHLMTRSGLQFKVAYLLEMTLGGAAQVAATHYPNERTLDPTVCSWTDSPVPQPAALWSPATTH